jgi:hypothetical protein
LLGRTIVAATFSLGLILASCVLPVPAPELDAFEESDLDFIRVGETTRQGVESVIGRASAWREPGLLSVYPLAIRDGYWVFLAPYSPPQISAIQSRKYILIQYSERNIVTSVDLLEDEGCSDNGICLYGLGGLYPNFMLTATKENDQERKQFLPLENRCSIFTYVTGKDEMIMVTLPGSNMGALLNQDGYIAKDFLPGIVAFDWYYSSNQRGRIKIMCREGQSHFVNISVEKNFLLVTAPIHAQEVASDVGRKAVMLRKLITDPVLAPELRRNDTPSETTMGP